MVTWLMHHYMAVREDGILSLSSASSPRCAEIIKGCTTNSFHNAEVGEWKNGEEEKINLHLPSAIAKSIPHVSVSSNNTFGRLERHCDSHCVLFSGVPYSLLLIQNGSFSLLSTAKNDLSLTSNKHFQCFTQQNKPCVYTLFTG